MKAKIACSLIILAMASALVGGATLALFTDQASAGPVAFTTGTVEITGQNLSGDITVSVIGVGGGRDIVSSSPPPPPQDPAKKTVTWCVENTGSKASYIRVRAHGGPVNILSESAAAEGTSYGASWLRQYFTYNPILDSQKETRLMADQDHHAGWVTVYHDYWNLYLRIDTINGWTLKDTKVFAETHNNFPSGFGQFRFKHPNLANVTSDLYTIPYITLSSSGINKTIYLVVHADVEKLPASWTLHANSSSWIPHQDGWWYYPNPVAAGEKVCIHFDVEYYDVGTEYQLEAEAVQASHNAINNIWNGHPLQ